MKDPPEFELTGLRWADLPVARSTISKLGAFGVWTVESTGVLAAYEMERAITGPRGAQAAELLREIKGSLEAAAVFDPFATAIEVDVGCQDDISLYQCTIRDASRHVRFSLKLPYGELEKVENYDNPVEVLELGTPVAVASWACDSAADLAATSAFPCELDTDAVAEVVGTLAPREARVISLRCGLEDGRTRTLEDVGRELNVTRERIRQIEAKALQKLRHPIRKNKCSSFVAEMQSLSETLALEIDSSEFREALNVLSRPGKMDVRGALHLAMEAGFIKEGKRQSFADFVPLLSRVSIARFGRLKPDLRRVPPEILGELIDTDEVRQVVAEWPRFSPPARLKVAALHPESRPRLSIRTLRLTGIERILEEAGAPLHFRDIASRLNNLLPPRAAMSDRNVHAWLDRYDDKFVWTGRGMYGLTRWDVGRRIDRSKVGLPGGLRTKRRRGIAEEIALILLETGGGIQLDELEELILSRFTVNRASVRAAIEQDAADRFTLDRGIVYLSG